ncbi:MAG: metallophosphoesterase [Clostridia bacterium]|nr:metallophosphoesterase [Clostridia bacterium]
MATYFCSDIHGEYDLFCRLLDLIRFSGGDTIFVLGDFLDKGAASVKLANLLMKTEGVRAILGNHEHYFLRYYSCCAEECGENSDEFKRRIKEYFPYDREVASPETAKFVRGLPYYIEEKDFICVHAGVQMNEIGVVKPMAEQRENVMIFDRDFKEHTKIPRLSKTVLFGHTPCSYENGTGEFIKTPRSSVMPAVSLSDFVKIRLDTGVSLTGMLGCLRKEDMKEFYVKKRI